MKGQNAWEKSLRKNFGNSQSIHLRAVIRINFTDPFFLKWSQIPKNNYSIKTTKRGYGKLNVLRRKYSREKPIICPFKNIHFFHGNFIKQKCASWRFFRGQIWIFSLRDFDNISILDQHLNFRPNSSFYGLTPISSLRQNKCTFN